MTNNDPSSKAMQTTNIDPSEIAALVKSVEETMDDDRIKPDGPFREISAHAPGPYLSLEFDLLVTQAECDEIVPGDFGKSAIGEAIVSTLDTGADATKLTKAVSKQTCDQIAEGITEGLGGELSGIRHRLERYAVCTHRHQFEEDDGVATFHLPLGTQWGITKQLRDTTIHDTRENELYEVIKIHGDGVIVEPRESESTDCQKKLRLFGNRSLRNNRYVFPDLSEDDLPSVLVKR